MEVIQINEIKAHSKAIVDEYGAQGLIPLCASSERLWSACRGAVGRAERQRLGTLCRSLAGLGEYRHLEDELGPCGPGGDLDATAQAVAVRHEGEKILRDFSGGLRPRGGKMAIGELPARRAILAALAGHRRIQGSHRHASCWRLPGPCNGPASPSLGLPGWFVLQSGGRLL